MSTCLICGSPAIEEIQGFSDLGRVTSDCRIWPAGGHLCRCLECGLVQKPADAVFSRETAEIYATYRLYFQGDGTEQKIFADGRGRPRSAILLDHFLGRLDQGQGNGPPFAGKRWLDLGCGRGHLLRGLAERNLGWRLVGAEIGEKNRPEIEAIPGVEGYSATGLEGVGSARFDVVSLSHVLEHIPSPPEFLRAVSGHLEEGGHLLVAVPNWQDNPFDLVVADHCLHFTAERLHATLGDAGFDVLGLGDGIIPKELIAIGRAHRSGAVPPRPADRQREGAQVHATVEWLRRVKAWADGKTAKGECGLFGTALAATWVAGASSGSFGFFVEEDPSRAGKAYLDRPVIAPAQVKAGATVLVPFPPSIAGRICDRLNRLGGATYLPPPPLGADTISCSPIPGAEGCGR